jgi:hypothetical protein
VKITWKDLKKKNSGIKTNNRLRRNNNNNNNNNKKYQRGIMEQSTVHLILAILQKQTFKVKSCFVL